MGYKLPGGTYSSPTHSIRSGLPITPACGLRKSKRKGSALTKTAKKGKSTIETFQRKVIVFKYMGGTQAPVHFTRKDSLIVVRGMTPEIPLDATEEEVRSELCEIIKNSQQNNLDSCQPGDFEFIVMSGKHSSVPSVKPGTTFNCKVVKKLAGSGSLYIRLMRDLEDEDNEWGGYEPIAESDPDVEVIKVDPGVPPFIQSSVSSEPCPTAHAQTLVSTHTSSAVGCGTDSTPGPGSSVGTHESSLTGHQMTSTPGHSASEHGLGRSSAQTYTYATGDTSQEGSGFSTHSCSASPCDDATCLPDVSAVLGVKHKSENDDSAVRPPVTMEQLVDIFPQLSGDQLKFLHEYCGKDTGKIMEKILNGINMDTLRRMVRSNRIKKELCESPRLRVNADDEEDEWVEAALAFYKASKFEKDAQLRVLVRGQPGIDTGGVRRQFLSVVLQQLALSDSLKLFEGANNHLRPVFRLSNLSSGLLKVAGTIVGHSYLLDGQGFPFLSDGCYYYLCGCSDRAMTSITEADVSSHVQSLVKEVSYVTVI